MSNLKLKAALTLAIIGGLTLILTSDPSTQAQAAPPKPLAIGSSAPSPSAKDEEGQPLDLKALYQKGPVFIYFYPKADTPGCTAQACSLRDAYAKLTDAGLTVIGVSTDSAKAQKAFKEKYKLPFTLISDPNKLVLKAFGVPNTFGFARREAFLIKDSKIVWHDAKAKTDKQAEDVLGQISGW